MTETRVRPLGLGDIRECAELHRRAFPGFFLSELGPAFLREFYTSFVGDQDAIALVAVVGDTSVGGAVVGTLRPEGFFGRLVRRRWYAFAAASIVTVLRRPRSVPRLVRALRYRGQVPFEVDGALLSSICVDPDRATGSGQLLLEAFQQAVRERGGASAYLTTDADHNERVNSFYRRAGWDLAGVFVTPEGRRMSCYTWHDTPAASASSRRTHD